MYIYISLKYYLNKETNKYNIYIYALAYVVDVCIYLKCFHHTLFSIELMHIHARTHTKVIAPPVRRQRRQEVRSQKWRGFRPRSRKYLAPWSSEQARAESSCQTHKEGEQHVAAASKSAGFLLAVSSGGLI